MYNNEELNLSVEDLLLLVKRYLNLETYIDKLYKLLQVEEGSLNVELPFLNDNECLICIYHNDELLINYIINTEQDYISIYSRNKLQLINRVTDSVFFVTVDRSKYIEYSEIVQWD
jgi:hypothetical protein